MLHRLRVAAWPMCWRIWRLSRSGRSASWWRPAPHRHAQGFSTAWRCWCKRAQAQFRTMAICSCYASGAAGDSKCLWHDGQGMCLFAKRLERGHFVGQRPFLARARIGRCDHEGEDGIFAGRKSIGVSANTRGAAICRRNAIVNSLERITSERIVTLDGMEGRS